MRSVGNLYDRKWVVVREKYDREKATPFLDLEHFIQTDQILNLQNGALSQERTFFFMERYCFSLYPYS